MFDHVPPEPKHRPADEILTRILTQRQTADAIAEEIESTLGKSLHQPLPGTEQRIDSASTRAGALSNRPHPNRVDPTFHDELLGSLQQRHLRPLVVFPRPAHA